ncbi:MAG: MFS transporter, partial [Haemophilus parainfluenzae]|nr:MFS transporter [Haemophilus parainfluenzae]
FMPLTTITLSGLPPEKMASASSLFNFLRTLAGSIGTSLTTFMWYNREAVHHTQLTEVINPYNPISQQFFQTMGGFGLSEEQTASYLARQITAQGFIIGANEIFLVSAITFISLVVLIWFAKPPFGGKH